ncbi:MAG TPA: adenylyl-sulfate kinase, partial [Polyangiaceae bacterium]
FYETVARLAALVARQGFVVLVPATAHRRTFRDIARRLAPAFVEVWIDTPQAECEKRDTKGLYAASRRGSACFVPGIAETYEPPETADVIAHGGRDARALDQLAEKLTGLAVSKPVIQRA